MSSWCSSTQCLMLYVIDSHLEDCVFDAYCPSHCTEDPPPPPVRLSPRYVVLDTSTDLVLEARFRGSYFAHDWVYNVDDPTFRTGRTSLFPAATRTNIGQTYTISAGSNALRVGYYGPYILPTQRTTILPTPDNTVIVGSFGMTTKDSQGCIYLPCVTIFAVVLPMCSSFQCLHQWTSQCSSDGCCWE